MSNPWSIITSSKDEPILLESVSELSEELCSRLQIEEGFVWVDVPEVQLIEETPESANATDLETVNKFQIYSERDINVAQQFSDDENDGATILDEDSVDPDIWDQFKYKKNHNNYAKVKYHSPKWMKRLEYGTVKINSGEKNTCDGNKSSLLSNLNFPPSTIAVLEKFITDRYLGSYNYVVATGKNSVVLNANCHKGPCMTMPCRNAVKVYKISNNVEKNKLIFKRVQKEFEHLKIVYQHRKIHGDFKFNCPQPIRARENVIVMAFAGCNITTIQDLPSEMDTYMYTEIVQFMERCYNVMHLVHGKLSAKKISFALGDPYFIGWSHSVRADHPMAMSKLMKDCQFITEFYKKRAVNVQSTEDLFKYITGVSKISNKLMKIVNENLYDKYDCNPNRKNVDANGKCRFK